MTQINKTLKQTRAMANREIFVNQRLTTYFTKHFNYTTGFKTSDIENLNEYFSIKEIKKNNFIFFEDSEVEESVFIVKGAVKLIRKYDSSNHQVLALLTEKNINAINKITQYNDKINYSAYCTENTFLLSIKQDKIQELITERPIFQSFFSESQKSTVRFLQSRVTILQMMSAYERYEDLCKNCSEITNRFNLKDIANFLGMKSETLSRIRNSTLRKAS